MLHDGAPCLVARGGLRPWSSAGYGAARPVPERPLEVLTPAATVAVPAAGYMPELHPSADLPISSGVGGDC